MTPRRYRMGRRQQAVDATRARIVAAARRLLLTRRPGEFSLEAVARRARVTRMTVYHQFGSRRALLEALFDDLAARGGMWDLRNAFQLADAEQALARYVATLGRFWTSARLIHRRLQALGVLDPELGRAIAARQEWRRQGLRVIAACGPRMWPAPRPMSAGPTSFVPAEVGSVYRAMGLLTDSTRLRFVGSLRYLAAGTPDSSLAVLSVSLRNAA